LLPWWLSRGGQAAAFRCAATQDGIESGFDG
jgi:hypothetical protein